jgi:hypothetical protein
MIHTSTASRTMTTFIQQETETYFNLTSPKGKKIGVSLRPFGHVSVYIRRGWFLRNGTVGLAGGKHFRSFAEAITAYKSADVRAALEAFAA